MYIYRLDMMELLRLVDASLPLNAYEVKNEAAKSTKTLKTLADTPAGIRARNTMHNRVRFDKRKLNIFIYGSRKFIMKEADILRCRNICIYILFGFVRSQLKKKPLVGPIPPCGHIYLFNLCVCTPFLSIC